MFSASRSQPPLIPHSSGSLGYDAATPISGTCREAYDLD